ncbi:MAG: DUF6056 family protein [Succinivibrio sp.]|nr:DUF6056 family protein [Succinivibrio sp.]
MRFKTCAYLLLWAVFIFACAQMIPYFSNDYRYMLIQGGDDLVSSFKDLVISQWNHYFDWGGRTVAHTIAQLLLWWGKPWAAIANTLCFLAMVLLIYFHAFGIRPTLRGLKLMPLFIITLGIWLCLRIFGEVVFMQVSSCNYLWTTTIIIAFLLPYRLSLGEPKASGGVAAAAGMFVLGILAGWTNENTGFAACCGVGVAGLWLLKQHRVRLLHVTGGLGLAAGYLLLMLSPGNAARLEFMQEGGYTFAKHFPVAAGIFFTTLLTQLPLLLCMAFMIFKLKKGGFDRRSPDLWRGALWLFFIGFVSLAIMVFSPNFPSRSAAPFTFFTVAAIAGLYSLAEREHAWLVPYRLSRILCLLGAVYLCVTMPNTLWGYHQAMLDQKVRSQEIAEQLSKGARNLVVHPFHVRTSKYLFIGDVRAQKTYFANQILEKFYKVDSIRRSCNYKMPWYSYDYIVWAHTGKPVCTGDRGDPEDPGDPVNQRYLKDHPEEIWRLNFDASQQSINRQQFTEAMERLGLENPAQYFKKAEGGK